MKIIETNVSLENDKIIDHQSRVIEANSWELYIKEIIDNAIIIKSCLYGVCIGSSIPQWGKIKNILYDDFHLSYDIYDDNDIKVQKGLAYLIESDTGTIELENGSVLKILKPDNVCRGVRAKNML